MSFQFFSRKMTKILLSKCVIRLQTDRVFTLIASLGLASVIRSILTHYLSFSRKLERINNPKRIK